jgi:hypothetical protein
MKIEKQLQSVLAASRKLILVDEVTVKKCCWNWQIKPEKIVNLF